MVFPVVVLVFDFDGRIFTKGVTWPLNDTKRAAGNSQTTGLKKSFFIAHVCV
jgi:hypothetical protein